MFIKFNICGSYNLTNNIYILPQKKMAKKEKKRAFIHGSFIQLIYTLKKFKILPLKNINVK